MSKSSTTTVRRTPVQAVSAASDTMLVHAETLTVETRERVELVDVTVEIAERVRLSGLREGTVSIFSLHTTCAVFINEAQQALHSDIKQFLEQVAARDGGWRHNDPAHSDCDRSNADSHLRAMLLGHSLTLQVTAGEPVLGQWQRVIVGELDGPRTRTLRVQMMGLGPGASPGGSV